LFTLILPRRRGCNNTHREALMLNQQTLEKLHALRLHGMADAFRSQVEQKGIAELSFEERFALLVDQQWTWRQNRALERRLAKAQLRHRASVEDIDFRSPRSLDRTLLRSLTQHELTEVANVGLAPQRGQGGPTMARESTDIPHSMRKVYRRFERWRNA